MTPAEYVRKQYEPGDRVTVVAIPRDAGRGRDGAGPMVEQRAWPIATVAW